MGFRENDINNRFNISPSIAANFSYVSQQILVLTKQTVTIQDDIFYEGTLTEGQIVNIIKSGGIYNFSNPYPYLTVIAQDIVFDSIWPDMYASTGVTSDPGSYFFCAGNFVAMFDNNSKISWVSNGRSRNICIFGSFQAANMDLLNENIGKYFVSDNRLTTKDPSIKLVPNLTTDSLYLNTLTPVFTEVIK